MSMIAVVLIQLLFSLSLSGGISAQAAMPFYGLNSQELVLRSRFSTVYTKSISERKSNIKLAASSFNGYFLDVGAEFSFNRVVGRRTTSRGYKNAKIIVQGKFVDGVGGGVCQVSTTLYNAVLSAGLRVTEFHAHSLPVSYVPPSFDAMVNSGSADLRFVNDTSGPIIIYTKADGDRLTVSIWGEPLTEEIRCESVITGKISAPAEERIKDVNGEYPDLFFGESKVISYSKDGIKSEGFLIKFVDGRAVSKVKIRSDNYNSQKGLIIEGTAVRPTNYGEEEVEQSFPFCDENVYEL